MKKSIYFLFFAIIFSCNNSIEPIDPSFYVKEPEPTQVKITVEGLESINYESVSALTIDFNNEISTDGIFENPYIDNGVENLPVLFVQDEDVLFGYFPHTLKTNKVTIDDILLFYFLTYPEIAIQGIEESVVLSGIKVSEDYNEMKKLVVSSLSNNLSPVDNPEFVKLIKSTSVVIKESFTSKNKDVKAEAFKFTYDREGNISWLNEISLYAAFGVSIKNETTGKTVLKSTMLKSKSLVFSPVSIISWAYDEFFTDNNEVKVESFKLKDDGAYNISFSNGNGVDSELNNIIAEKNNANLAANMVGYILPFSLKTLKLEKNCTDATTQVMADVYTKASQLAIKREIPETSALIGILIGLSESATKAFSQCLSATSNSKLYLKLLGSTATKYLSTVEDVSTLVLFLRDYLASEISGEEKRNFYNGVSFGHLKQDEEQAEVKFEGDSETEHVYTKKIEELTRSYDVDNGIIETLFTQIDEWSKPSNLPFTPEITSGDAKISDNGFNNGSHIYTNTEGVLNVKMEMGTEESVVKIKPNFTSTVIKDVLITLTPPSTIALYGNMVFEDIRVNTTKGETLTITNNSDEILNISSINLPDGYTSTWEYKPIQPKESQTIIVVFEPTEAKNYNGTIQVVNNIDDVNNTIDVTGEGTDDTITLEGNLDFGNVVVNPETPPTRTLFISNYNLNKSINVEAFPNLPEGFTATGWVNGGVLSPSMKKEIIITFNPTIAKSYGNTTLNILNDVDEINNKIQLSGTGINETISIEGIWFGESTITECKPARSDSVNPNCEMHSVLNERDVEFLEGATGFCPADVVCGSVEFSFYTNSESIYRNKLEFDGTTLTIDVRTNSSGSYFNGRVYKYTGTLNEDGTKFEGTYTMDMPGGIWGGYTEGTMTYTRK
ncbi:hypothetical protein GCM10022291_07610 [Postechiella marina]|uniref:Abnormal spindle-like microcephaly-associated protein ASH domain-containing protein n=1 Tax=Postechiella marina TaxID=943941 RepID=A0ABP8C2G8_9FLAO